MPHRLGCGTRVDGTGPTHPPSGMTAARSRAISLHEDDSTCGPRQTPTMNVSLTEELEEFVRRKVESGRCRSATEVIRAGFRLLEQADERRDTRLATTRARVEEGIAQAERGELGGGEEAVGRVGRRAAARRRRGRERTEATFSLHSPSPARTISGLRSGAVRLRPRGRSARFASPRLPAARRELRNRTHPRGNCSSALLVPARRAIAHRATSRRSSSPNRSRSSR